MDAEFIIHVDDPFFQFVHEKLVPPMSLEQYRDWAQLRIDAPNSALKEIPVKKRSYHICWG